MGFCHLRHLLCLLKQVLYFKRFRSHLCSPFFCVWVLGSCLLSYLATVPPFLFMWGRGPYLLICVGPQSLCVIGSAQTDNSLLSLSALCPSSSLVARLRTGRPGQARGPQGSTGAWWMDSSFSM
jgi:hypothetical protein